MLLPFSASAQKGKRKAVSKKKAPVTIVQEEPEEEEEDPRLQQMLNATERIIVIDSMVVGRNNVLAAIFPNPEEGRLVSYKDFFHEGNDTTGYVYVNELGNRCIFSKPNANGHMQLYSRDLIGNKWSEPELLKGLNGKEFSDLNYPYLMPDGVTLYFAARGSESLGGYDIYRTRLDSESGRYLKPENIGMPFCSDNDDFFYVIDEQNKLGYFATTRRQAKGKVCVYTFIPNETRSIYDADIIGLTRLHSLAQLNRIADTWGNGKARKEALKRKQAATAIHPIATNASHHDVAFVINDQTIYSGISDFRAPELFRELQSLQTRTEELDKALQKSRTYYARTSKEEQLQLKQEILSMEQQLEQLQQQIREKEKEIRNTENNAIKE